MLWGLCMVVFIKHDLNVDTYRKWTKPRSCFCNSKFHGTKPIIQQRQTRNGHYSQSLTYNACICTPAAREDLKTQQCCNCRGGKEACPLGGECLAKGVVYEASVTCSTVTIFKKRHVNHKASLEHEIKQHHTELFMFTWQLNWTSTAYQVKWRILQWVREYSINSISIATSASQRSY